MSSTKWHAVSKEDVFREVSSSLEGLSEEEAKERLLKYGLNEIRKEKTTSPFKIFAEQFNNILIILLLAATVLSLLVGEILDALVIFVIVVASAGLGFIQEYRSEKAIQFLQQLAAPAAIVIRGGKEKAVSSKDVVPGDIVVLRAGDRVPADLRLLEVFNLKIDEMSLTGESLPVDKETKVIQENTIISDRVNMAFNGTIVTYGRSVGIAIATGMNTEFGKIAKSVQEETKTETPLEKRMDAIGKWLTLFALGVCAIVATLGFFRGYELLDMVIWGISLAVAAVPEALPAVVTGSLAIGMYEMAKKKSIVKRLPAVETLGSTSVICSDKTGTMTKGEMTIRSIYVDDKFVDVSGVGYEPKGSFSIEGVVVEPRKIEGLYRLLKAAALCNDAKLIHEGDKWSISGDTTEGALLVATTKASIPETELKAHNRINEIPFTSERKRMTTVHVVPEWDKKLVVMKGAPEVVLEKCKWVLKGAWESEMTLEEKNKILAVNEKMASEAYRNLALAYKEEAYVPEELDENEFEENFIFLGIVGMIDPPREEVKKAVKLCKDAGIRVVMITGDHKLTAIAVAKEIGILHDENAKVLTGLELERMSDEEYGDIVEDVNLYARVSPEHKMKIVKALKNKGYVVAMTGDGINDATALKMSDIGISMGITGTEVTKETSDMILADDNFATIVNAVKEGRRIFDNIKKYLVFLLQCNLAEITVMLVSILAGLPLPLTAIQLLWVNLTTDGLPALALGVEPAEPDIMERKPKPQTASIINRKEMLLYLVIVPVTLSIILLSNFVWALQTEPEAEARTQVLTVMIVCELLIALSCHSLKHTIVRSQIFSNKFLWLSIAISFALQLIVLYVPFMHEPFGITYPSTQDWILAGLSALAILVVVESAKWFFRNDNT